MILGNDWRTVGNFTLKHKSNTWDVYAAEDGQQGYYVFTYEAGGPEEVEAEFFYSLSNGNAEFPDVAAYCKGFMEAIGAKDSVIHIHQ